MKRWLSFSLFALLMVLAAAPAAAHEEPDIKVNLNGKGVVFPDQKPFIDNGRTLVPIRAVFSGLIKKAEDIAWDGNTRTATVTVGSTVIKIQADNKIALVNDKPIELDVPAAIVNNRIVVPLRFMIEALTGEVHWEGETRTITLGTTASAKAAVKARKAEEKAAGTFLASAAMTGTVNANWTVTGQRASAGEQLYKVDVKLGTLGTMDYLFTVKDGKSAVKDGYGKWKTLGTPRLMWDEAGVPIDPTNMMAVLMGVAESYESNQTEAGTVLSFTFDAAKTKALHDKIAAKFPLSGTSELKTFTGSVTLNADGVPVKSELTAGGAYTYNLYGQTKTEDWALTVHATWTPGAVQISFPEDMPK